MWRKQPKYSATEPSTQKYIYLHICLHIYFPDALVSWSITQSVEPPPLGHPLVTRHSLMLSYDLDDLTHIVTGMEFNRLITQKRALDTTRQREWNITGLIFKYVQDDRSSQHNLL